MADLRLDATIGFNGSVQNGMIATQINGDDCLVYPLGASIVIRNLRTKAQSFLQGHTGQISCVAVSLDGRLCASGQVGGTSGSKSPIRIWDLEAAVRNGNSSNREGEFIMELALHKLQVRSLAFSDDGKYLASCGGQDDNSLVVWDMDDISSTKTQSDVSLCGIPISNVGSVTTVQWFHNITQTGNGCDYQIVAAGDKFIKTYSLDGVTKKFNLAACKHVNMGSLMRQFQSLAITPNDEFMLAGTASGEVCVFELNNNGSSEPVVSYRYKIDDGEGTKFAGGVRQIEVIPYNENPFNRQCEYALLVGGGAGKLRLIRLSEKQNRRQMSDFESTLMGGAFSITPQLSKTGMYWVGTDAGNMYQVDIVKDSTLEPGEQQFYPHLMTTAHQNEINAVVFPEGCSELCITAGSDIRIWNTTIRAELLRIQVSTTSAAKCNCIALSENGSVIVSGWQDGKIRGFLPETGRLVFCINNAHENGVSAIQIFNEPIQEGCSFKLVSGGGEGRVRVWEVNPFASNEGTEKRFSTMLFTMKEHKARVTDIKISADNSVFISTARDGSTIAWHLDGDNAGKRAFAVNANTQFEAVAYHPDQSQYLTLGSDRKITYWDANGESDAIRIIQGSDDSHSGGPLTALDIDAAGDYFVSGGEDKLVKVWSYDEGECLGVGRAHSNSVMAVKIAPDNKTVVSVGKEGAMMFWEMVS